MSQPSPSATLGFVIAGIRGSLIRYFVGRLLQALVTLAIFMTVLFVVTRAAGDPAMLVLPSDATPEMIQATRARIGVDRPYVEQFVFFLRDMVTLDFGRSIVYREPVIDLLRPRIWASLQLQLASLALILVTAFPLGVLAAVRRGRFADTSRAIAGRARAVGAEFLGRPCVDDRVLGEARLVSRGTIGRGRRRKLAEFRPADGHDVAVSLCVADAAAAIVNS